MPNIREIIRLTQRAGTRALPVGMLVLSGCEGEIVSSASTEHFIALSQRELAFQADHANLINYLKQVSLKLNQTDDSYVMIVHPDKFSGLATVLTDEGRKPRWAPLFDERTELPHELWFEQHKPLPFEVVHGAFIVSSTQTLPDGTQIDGKWLVHYDKREVVCLPIGSITVNSDGEAQKEDHIALQFLPEPR